MDADSGQDRSTTEGDSAASFEAVASLPSRIPPWNDENHERTVLETEKVRLEVQKLTEEVATAREGRKWWRRSVRDVKANEWVVAFAAVAAFTAAYLTGLFSSIRERLEVEKIDLEQRKEKLVVEVAAKEKELADLRARLLPYEDEQAAIHELQNLDKTAKLHVEFGATNVVDGLKVSISPVPSGPDRFTSWSGIEPWKPIPPVRVPALANALGSVSRLRSVKELRVRYLVLSPADLQLVPCPD